MMVYGGQDRQPIIVGPEMARGGQGTIHTVEANADWLAKLYFKPDPADGDRLQWMVSHAPPRLGTVAHPLTVAWPLSLLYEGRPGGKFVGYVMPRVRDSVLALNLITPKIRLRQWPKFDTRYLHRTARNLATAMGVVHNSDYVVGDLNESNVLVNAGALVTLIDVDSFQTIEIRAERRIIHPCPVGKPEYTAPELQGAQLSRVMRTNAHDAFALGVLVFQLLMAGRHPFQSIWQGPGEAPPIADKIHRGLFPYTAAHPALVAPPPHSTLDVLHPRLHALMLRCFVDGQADPSRRPAPDEWEKALAQAETGLVNCQFGHCYSGHLSLCPECQTERLARQRAAQPAHRASHWPVPAESAGASHPPLVLAANRPPPTRVARLMAISSVLGILFVIANVMAAIVNATSPQSNFANSAANPATTASPVLLTVRTAAAPASTATTMPTPVPTLVPASPSPDQSVHLTGLADLRSGPGPEFPLLDTLARETEIVPLGRTLDASWLYIMVAANSERGWVDMRNVAFPRGSDKLDVPILLPLTPLP